MRKALYVVLVLAGLALVHACGVQVASSDCAGAATSFEKAVCSNPDLARKSKQLAVAYATAMGGLSQTSAQDMKSDQTNWLAALEDNCARTLESDGNDGIDVDLECASRMVSNRIQNLSASRMVNGWRFYVEEKFRTVRYRLPDAPENGFSSIGYEHITIPRMDAEDANAVKFNAFIDQTNSDYLAGFASQKDGKPSVTDIIESEDGRDSYDSELRMIVTSASDERITIKENLYSFVEGTPHGQYNTAYYHYLPKQNRELTSQDVFTGQEWKRTLAKIVLSKLRAQLGERLFDPNDMSSVLSQASDPRAWQFSSAGLIVHFNPYEVASYANGDVDVIVPWHEISSMLVSTQYVDDENEYMMGRTP